MNSIYKITFLVLLAFITAIPLNAQSKRKKRKADEATMSWRYETVCEKTGGSRSGRLIRVTSYVADPVISIEQSKKNAIHAIIFTGITGNGPCDYKSPLSKNPSVYDENLEFFKNFFKSGGVYAKYANLPTGRPERAIKMSKKEYKVETIVSVNESLLRKDLEKANIIKSLSSGF